MYLRTGLTALRFNDLITTALSGRAETARSRAILWRQCVDLFAQFDGHGIDAAELDSLAAALEGMRGKVETEHKLAGLAELGGRLTSPRLVRLLLREEARVQVAAMRRARLADADWPALIADAGPLARSVLRRRDDMGDAARRALHAFGPFDLALADFSGMIEGEEALDAPTPPVAAPQAPLLASVTPLSPPAPVEQSQILRIVDRIERFTSERQERVGRPAALGDTDTDADDGSDAGIEMPTATPAPAQAVDRFVFMTDADGVIRSVAGAPRAMLAGFRFASPSLDRSTGPDGQILGAFRRRGAFREGRLTIGEGPLAGCWLVDGDPLFDQRTGRFTGYRAMASRASDHAIAPFVAAPADTAPAGGDSVSLRELIHELRSPLSGVMGFAELIESQLLGPVNDSYRTMAGEIVTDVRKLVDILDDLDFANRADRQTAPVPPRGADVAALLAETVGRIGPDAEGRARICLSDMPALPAVDVAPTIAERMIVHLVRALASCVGTETLDVRCRREGEALLVEFDRPAAMTGLSDAQLFDSGFEHVATAMDEPVLGVGFALRLVRRLARANRGALRVLPGHFALTLPLPAGAREQGVTS